MSNLSKNNIIFFLALGFKYNEHRKNTSTRRQRGVSELHCIVITSVECVADEKIKTLHILCRAINLVAHLASKYETPRN